MRLHRLRAHAEARADFGHAETPPARKGETSTARVVFCERSTTSTPPFHVPSGTFGVAGDHSVERSNVISGTLGAAKRREGNRCDKA
jgi:hypothetical protein